MGKAARHLVLLPRAPSDGGSEIGAAAVHRRVMSTLPPITLVPEDPLIEAAVAGDRQAMGKLLRRLLPNVRKVLVRYGGNSQDLDDWTQEALMAIAKALPQFRGEAALASWAHRICARVVYRKFRTPDRVVALEFEPKVHSGAESWVNLGHLSQAVDRLPPELRTVFVMRHVEGYKAREIAEILKVPPGTVATRIRNAKLQLQRTLRAWSQ